VAGSETDVRKRLDPLHVRKLLSRILRTGAVAFCKHARDAMEDDDLTEPDVVNILRCGTIRDGELEKGSWRYRVETGRMCAVITFRSGSEVTIVTVWRSKARGA
jgi:hypothetical protein